jgi:hypothetical protein
MVDNAQVEETLMSPFDLFLYPIRFRADISSDGTSWGGAKLFADAVDDFLKNQIGYLPVWGRSGIRAVLFDGSARRWSLIEAAMKEVDTSRPAGISLRLRVARPRMKFIARVDWHGTVAFEVGASVEADLESFEKKAEQAFNSRLINGRFGGNSWRRPEKVDAAKSNLAPQGASRATHAATPKIAAEYTASIPAAPSTILKGRLRGWGRAVGGIFVAVVATLIANFIWRFIG